jgi:hypothetical protein
MMKLKRTNSRIIVLVASDCIGLPEAEQQSIIWAAASGRIPAAQIIQTRPSQNGQNQPLNKPQ